jgi:hypothetical protein
MKIGLYYLDRNTGLLLRCLNFTRSKYVWIDVYGALIDEWKTDAWAHVSHQAVRQKTVIAERFIKPFQTNRPTLCVACCGRREVIDETWPPTPCPFCRGTGRAGVPPDFWQPV